jgi:acetylornithine deacetylase/succinyl-diaminopimelate desuccinylase-like protein
MNVVNLLQELIRIESHTDGRPITTHVAEILKDMGAQISAYGLEEKPAILAEFGKGGVIFSGHLDTVVMGEWDFEQGEIHDDRLYGRGSSDMKSGCAAMITAAEKLKDEVPFALAFTTDEEITMKGAEELAKTERIQTAPIIVVGEPTGLKVGTGEKGILWLKAETKGKSSHGSMPWIGENAILKMVDHLKGVTPYTDKEGITINIGMIEGGRQINVTADTCVAQLDVRYPPTMKKEGVIKKIEEITGLPLTVKYDLPPVTIDTTRKEVKTLINLSEGVCTCYYATEAVKFSPYSPTVILGPGEPEMAHQKNEFVIITQIEKAVEIYTEYALTYHLMKG